MSCLNDITNRTQHCDLVKTGSLSWFTRQHALDQETSCYVTSVLSAFPSLDDPSVKIPLPSSFTQLHSDDIPFLRWSNAELDLRVGRGHDILKDIQTATSLHSFFSRKQKTTTRGHKEMTKVADSQKRISKKKSQLMAAYTRNWKNIQALLSLLQLQSPESEQRLHGLQPLRTDNLFLPILPDANSLTTNGHDPPYALSLQWTHRLEQASLPGDLPDWEQEGQLLDVVITFAIR